MDCLNNLKYSETNKNQRFLRFENINIFETFISKLVLLSYGDVKMIELTKLSSKGQVVLPKDLREGMHLDAGTTFAVFGKDDTIVLKKVKVPDAKQVFEKVHKWGINFAKERGIKEKDMEKVIHQRRGLKSG